MWESWCILTVAPGLPMHTPKARCFTLEHYPPKIWPWWNKVPRNTLILPTTFGTHPFPPKLMANIPRSNSIWTTSEYSPLDYTLFFISSTRHKKRKPALVHANVTKKSTLYRSILPPQAPFSQRLVNKDTLLHPLQARPISWLFTTLTLVLATQTSPPLPVASDQRLWQATHYRQHPNIGSSPLLKELIFIDPDSRIANENTAA